MSWFYLVVAGAFEIVWAYAMKQSYGFTRLVPSLVTISAMLVSFWLSVKRDFLMQNLPACSLRKILLMSTVVFRGDYLKTLRIRLFSIPPRKKVSFAHTPQFSNVVTMRS